jgi:hypothetical protein
MEARGIPSVMIVTDTFAQFGRRISATEGCPYVMIAETPNPIRQLDVDAIRARVEAMMPSIIDGLTLSVGEIERRMKEGAAGQIRATGIVRSSTPV